VHHLIVIPNLGPKTSTAGSWLWCRKCNFSYYEREGKCFCLCLWLFTKSHSVC